MEILKELGVNSTFFIQLINFIILSAILYKFLFKPLNKTITDRKNKAEELVKNIEKNQKNEEEIKVKEKEIVANANKEAQKIISNAQKKAEEEYKEIIEKAKNEALDIIKKSRLTLDQNNKEYTEVVNSKARQIAIDTLKEWTTKENNFDLLIDKITKTN